jgi:opacity protein-like surface antigen
MRIAALSLVGAVCLLASAMAANAAPAVPSPASQPEANIVQVAGGCGPGLHPNRWHRCVPNRYGYYRDRPVWRGYYGGGYYGGGYHGWSPSDHVANQLNAHQLSRGYYGGY